ncbi:MAG TPA: alkaline phosphatase family protein [Actinomycetota bacterium]|nr:alkaline phosphatase family protein [Actinomycetota bacterium]
MTRREERSSPGSSRTAVDSLLIPKYGEASLAEVVPSLLSAVGVPSFANALGLDALPGVCLVVIDGLGWVQLDEHRAQAAFLASGLETGRALTAGFPSTTATSLASLGTGLPPGAHGLVGLTVRMADGARPMSLLRWEVYGGGAATDLRDEVPPEKFQPSPTVLERARRSAVRITLVGPPENVGSGLTRAILRGGDHASATTLDELVEVTGEAVATGRGAPVFAYHPFLDTIGHIRGVGTEEWGSYLQQVSEALEALLGRLPQGWALAVTSDHGMVNVEDGSRVDLGDEPALMTGVTVVAGEPRARHIHVEHGALDDVRSRWTERLDGIAWVLSGDEAVEQGLFGDEVREYVRPRIGDLVVAARGNGGVFHRLEEPVLAGLIGQHGSLTPAEQLVPLLFFVK